MVSLGQKLKLPKRCEKRLYEHIRVVVCKKPLQKTPNIPKTRHFKNGKNWPRRKGYSLCKMVSLGQKLKMPKTCEKRLYEHIRVNVCRKPLKKTRNIRKKEHFENGQNWPRRKGYSLGKMVGLGQKFKTPKRCEKQLYEHIRVVVCKKPLQKNT